LNIFSDDVKTFLRVYYERFRTRVNNRDEPCSLFTARSNPGIKYNELDNHILADIFMRAVEVAGIRSGSRYLSNQRSNMYQLGTYGDERIRSGLDCCYIRSTQTDRSVMPIEKVREIELWRLSNLMQMIDRILGARHSILDVIIRCCNMTSLFPEPEWEESLPGRSRYFYLPSIRYTDMMDMLLQSKYSKDLEQIFLN